MSADHGGWRENDEHHRLMRTRDPLQLDDGTLDRLLDGLAVDDAPPSYRGVAALLNAARAEPTAAELAGERQAVGAITARHHRAVPPPAPRPGRFPQQRRPRRRVRVSAAALVGSATLFVGLGAAGALPGAAQSVAADVLSTVGVSAPNPDSPAVVHPIAPVVATGAGTGAVAGSGTDGSTTGNEHGAEVSANASNGNSHAGGNGNGNVEGVAPGNSGTASDGTPSSDKTTPTDTNGNGGSGNGSGNGNGSSLKP